MDKHKFLKEFTKDLVDEKQRKNKVSTAGITSTMVSSAIELSFVNEACSSSGQLSKSQVLYRKLENVSKEDIEKSFRINVSKLLKILKIISRNRKFIISFDTTKEPFYGDFSKAKEPEYLHAGSEAKESYFYYEFLTVAITGNCLQKFVLDGIIVKRGTQISDWASKMVKCIKEKLPLEVVLFDRGFTSKELVYELNKLKVSYIIFWRKSGDWYKPYLNAMNEGDLSIIKKGCKFHRRKYRYDLNVSFAIIKQLEYNGKKYDWVFATNLKLGKAEFYVKLYKKRWGIETIYRITDRIRAYTTSTKSIIRYFLFMFTCFVYNLWRFCQIHLGEEFTLCNFKANTTIYLAKVGLMYPKHYDEFEKIFPPLN